MDRLPKLRRGYKNYSRIFVFVENFVRKIVNTSRAAL